MMRVRPARLREGPGSRRRRSFGPATRLAFLAIGLAGAPQGCARPSPRYRVGDIVVARVVAPAPVVLESLATATMSVYATITNEGAAPDTLGRVEAAWARTATLHTMSSGGGMSQMMPMNGLPVPAGATVQLAPGQAHVMLEGLQRAPVAGEEVPLTFVFRRAGRLDVHARVVPYSRLEQALREPIALRLPSPGGGAFDLAALRGKVVVVFFGYTHCPDVCPLTLANLASARRALLAHQEDLRFVFITVDPARDGPARVMAYARLFDSSFVGLSGDSAALARAEHAFHVASWVTRDSTGAVLVAHSASVFIVGRDGRLAGTVPYQSDPSELTAGIQWALTQ